MINKPRKSYIAQDIVIGLVIILLVGMAFTVNHKKKAATVTLTATQYYQNHDYANALVAINADIAKQPKESDSYNFRGNIERDKGDAAAAEADYAQAITLNPGVLAPYINLVNLELNLGEKEKSNLIITQGLKQFPGQVTLVGLQQLTRE